MFCFEFEAVLKCLVIWVRSHIFFVSTTSLLTRRGNIYSTLPMYVERLGLSWFFVNCYALFNRMVSLWHSSSRTCVISRGKVSFLDRYQTQIFLAVTGLWGSGKVRFLAWKFFSNVIVISQSSCVFLYLFSSANISPLRFVLHQWRSEVWWCPGRLLGWMPPFKILVLSSGV